MPKLATKISDALQPHLRPGEELRSVGQLVTGLPYWLSLPLLGILALAFTKPWWAGIAGDRLILIQLDAMSRPRPDTVLSVPLDHVEFQGKSLFVDLPGEAGTLSLTPGVKSLHQTRFQCHFGGKRFTGLDLEQFRAALLPQ